ncbi:hypothetical protein CEXT_20591 [Caerostris extrusa]|uniref:Transmembrane protein n=1 Tax=Caerostris extrusa TaxID=172846 RepID=A0AAV4QTL3_CAEEX|nr:hypothetical protein CEXT_20591 [Caerostris extrusa]
MNEPIRACKPSPVSRLTLAKGVTDASRPNKFHWRVLFQVFLVRCTYPVQCPPLCTVRFRGVFAFVRSMAWCCCQLAFVDLSIRMVRWVVVVLVLVAAVSADFRGELRGELVLFFLFLYFSLGCCMPFR